MRYVKKPVVIEAFEFDGDFIDKDGKRYVPQWAMDALGKGVMEFKGPELYINNAGRTTSCVGRGLHYPRRKWRTLPVQAGYI